MRKLLHKWWDIHRWHYLSFMSVDVRWCEYCPKEQYRNRLGWRVGSWKERT